MDKQDKINKEKNDLNTAYALGVEYGKELGRLRRFLNSLEVTCKELKTGFIEEFDLFTEDKTVLCQREIENLLLMMDYLRFHYHDDNKGQLAIILFQIDRYLMEYDLTHHKGAGAKLLQDMSPYTDFMHPTERGLLELKRTILNLECWLFGLYALKATIRAFKKRLGINKGFNYLERLLDLEKTALKWETTPLQALKQHCRAASGYQYEDYLACMNRGLIELKKRGIDLHLEPFNYKALRPTAETVKNIADTGAFFAPLFDAEDEFMIHIKQLSGFYVRQVQDYYLATAENLMATINELKQLQKAEGR